MSYLRFLVFVMALLVRILRRQKCQILNLHIPAKDLSILERGKPGNEATYGKHD